MKWVEVLPFGVNGCTAVPFVAKDDEGFFDLEIDNQWADPVYISATAVKEMARKLGWLSPSNREDLVNDLEQRDLRIQELEDELAEADRFQQNIDGLTKTGFMVKRAPGRPTTKKAA